MPHPCGELLLCIWIILAAKKFVKGEVAEDGDSTTIPTITSPQSVRRNCSSSTSSISSSPRKKRSESCSVSSSGSKRTSVSSGVKRGSRKTKQQLLNVKEFKYVAVNIPSSVFFLFNHRHICLGSLFSALMCIHSNLI